MPDSSTTGVVALLLASGRGARFDPTGRINKLVQRLPDGQSVIGRSTARLIAAGLAVTVIAPKDPRLVQALDGANVTWCENPAPERGMGASLALGVRATAQASAWLVALADMPFILPETIQKVASAILLEGTRIAAPYYDGDRGHPVAFCAALGLELGQLDGDAGARALLEKEPILKVETGDYGILRDIDRPQDLSA
jgi:molybdenum cofactor cytidylyltransferase